LSSLSFFFKYQNEDYETAQSKKDKMELYRTETYKQLQVLNLLDVVIVSKRKKNDLIDVFFLNDSFRLFFSSSSFINVKEGGQGTEFLKRLQEIENNEQQQQDDFNQEVDIFQCNHIPMCCTNSNYTVIELCNEHYSFNHHYLRA